MTVNIIQHASASGKNVKKINIYQYLNYNYRIYATFERPYGNVYNFNIRKFIIKYILPDGDEIRVSKKDVKIIISRIFENPAVITFTNMNSKKRINVSLYNFPLNQIIPDNTENLNFNISSKKFNIFSEYTFNIDDSMKTIFKQNVLKSNFFNKLQTGKIISFTWLNTLMPAIEKLNNEVIQMDEYSICEINIREYFQNIFTDLDISDITSIVK